MIVSTQPCFWPEYKPLGVVTSSAGYRDDFGITRFRKLLDDITIRAPQGTTHLFNFHVQEGFGYADAFRLDE